MKHRPTVLLAAVVSGVVLLAGCGGSSKPSVSAPLATSSSSATPSPPTADPTAQAKADALAAYQGMVTVTTREFATNKPDPDMMTYVSGNAYVFFNEVLTFRLKNNVVYQGTPQSAPVVTDIKPDGATPNATITDCFGGPSYVPVFASDKNGRKKGDSAVVPGTSVKAHPVTVILEKKDGHWLVINYTPSDQNTTC
jgi:hypothetical protein